ncbi:MAG: DUF3107 domain-containing protein [Acidimicrobiia bacterium]
MEVKVGVVYSPRELLLEVEGPAEDVVSAVESALGANSTAARVLWLTDRKGRRVGIPVDKVAYVELGVEDVSKRIGFGPG